MIQAMAQAVAVRDVVGKLRHATRHARAHVEFWAAWMRAPWRVGAIAPSGPVLCKVMALQALHFARKEHGYFVELGAGSGVVTRALLKQGVAASQLVVVEKDRKLAAWLGNAFGQSRVVDGDAMQLEQLLRQVHIRRGEVAAVVSSLPLLAMPPKVRDAIIDQMARVLPEGAPLVQFTYGLRSPIRPKQMARHRLQVVRKLRVLRNIPPCTVWIYQKQ